MHCSRSAISTMDLTFPNGPATIMATQDLSFHSLKDLNICQMCSLLLVYDNVVVKNNFHLYVSFNNDEKSLAIDMSQINLNKKFLNNNTLSSSYFYSVWGTTKEI